MFSRKEFDVKQKGESVEEESRRGWSDEQHAAIVDELNHLLAHPSFQSSKRCSALLRCMVDHALKGDEDLNERALGLEAFGRDDNYDTNTDPIVRRIAGEIRKRLTQCYQGPDCSRGVIIHLIPGGYLPEFEFAGEGRPPDAIKQEHGETPEPLSPHWPAVMYSKKISKTPYRKILMMMFVTGSMSLLCVPPSMSQDQRNGPPGDPPVSPGQQRMEPPDMPGGPGGPADYLKVQSVAHVEPGYEGKSKSEGSSK